MEGYATGLTGEDEKAKGTDVQYLSQIDRFRYSIGPASGAMYVYLHASTTHLWWIDDAAVD